MKLVPRLFVGSAPLLPPFLHIFVLPHSWHLPEYLQSNPYNRTRTGIIYLISSPASPSGSAAIFRRG
ncbi:hypothetical protein C8J57DRAFT_1299562 [Mycena rebaudengoi]|nr:hypothetical protein C8J57DRAFT_1299562 [Mycena rebaudengoi]